MPGFDQSSRQADTLSIESVHFTLTGEIIVVAGQLVYTKSAENLIRAAETKAHKLECPHVCTLCILLAILDLQNCVVYQTLESLRVDIRELKIRLQWNLAVVGKKCGRLPWTPRAKVIITEAAEREARARDSGKISIEDIVIALLKEDSAAAKEILENWVTTAQVHEQLYG